MADFKRIAQKLGGEGIHSEQQAGKKVFVEASFDAVLFEEYWFSELADRISFEAASESKKGGGCNAVKQKVVSHNELHRNEKAVGIVDRDSLLPNYSALFYESNDDVYYQHNFVDNIYTLNRWEIENYGLDLDNIRQCVKDKTFDESTAASSFESLQDAMVLQTCASTYRSKTGIKAALNPHETNLTTIRNRLKESYELSDDDIADEQSKITAFCNLEESFEQRWYQLARMLDGKKVIELLDIFYRNKLSNNKKKFSLTGSELLSRVPPPQELKDFIEQKVLGV